MSGMKTFLVIAALSASPAFAQAESAENQLRTFAACAGRLSAVMEYQWMFDGPASDQTKAQRAAVLELIDAIMPPDRGAEVLHWRISAKLAQSALLTRATFNDDPTDATWAEQRAASQLADCTGFLLG